MLSYTNTASSGARKRAMANALRGLRVAVYMVSCMESYKRRVGDRIRAAAGFGDGEGWTAADTATAGWAAVGTATAGRFYEF